MIIQAILVGIVGVFSVVKTDDVAQYLDPAQVTSPVEWLWSIIGILLVALSVHMATTSRNASDPALRRAALVMVAINALIAFKVYSVSDSVTHGRWSSMIVLAIFAVLYLITLPIKSIGIEASHDNS